MGISKSATCSRVPPLLRTPSPPRLLSLSASGPRPDRRADRQAGTDAGRELDTERAGADRQRELRDRLGWMQEDKRPHHPPSLERSCPGSPTAVSRGTSAPPSQSGSGAPPPCRAGCGTRTSSCSASR
eukprot:1902841-Pyramimonas_sp.AAC.1